MRYTLQMRVFIAALLVLAAGCGGHGVTPTPVPTTTTITAQLTNTVTGATVGTQAFTVASLPARLSITMGGFLVRTLTVSSAAPTVDLIPDAAPFDLAFYRELTRGALDGHTDALHMLSAMPAIYLQTAGLSAATVAALEQAARSAVPLMTGGRFSVGIFEMGQESRPEQTGWIVVDIAIPPSGMSCGLALVGAAAGHIWLSTAQGCGRNGAIIGSPSLFAHELGHALGFWHVSAPNSLMNAVIATAVTAPSSTERYHAAIAYHRRAGNTDIDNDPTTPSALTTRRVIE